MDYSETHKEIVEACKRNERKAQFELYRLYSRSMYNICLRMLNSEHDAEDVLQHSFMDIYSKLDSFRYQSSIGAWIKRIVINNCINHCKKKRLQFGELNDNIHGLAEEEREVRVDTYKVEYIKKAVRKLPDGYRIVFSLYAFEGYDHKEIGSIMNISEATSKSQYSRAKKKIKTILQDESHPFKLV